MALVGKIVVAHGRLPSPARRAQGLSKSVLNVIDFYHNKEIEWQTILGKLDVRQKRIQGLQDLFWVLNLMDVE